MAALPAGASAHAGLLSSTPAPGARLGAAPEVIRLSFSEQPQASLSEVTVLAGGGASEQLSPARQVKGDPLGLEVPVRRLGKGVYTVSWKVVSAVDGHASDGTFAFGVRVSPGVAARGDTRARTSRLELLARWVFLLGLLALLGGAVAGVARFGGEDGRDLRLAAAGWAVGVVGLALLAEAQRRAAGSSIADLLGTPVGEALLRRALGLLLAGLSLLAARRAPRLRRGALALGAAAVVGVVVAHVEAGHAAAGSWSTGIAVSAQSAHVLAAGVWLGGLAALLLGFRGAPAAARGAALRRFAALALVCFPLVLATGIVRAADELGSWSELLGTGYGRAVVAKLLLLAFIGGVAARNRTGRLRRSGDGGAGLRRRSIVELVVAVAAVGVAALLGSLAPPVSGQAGVAGLSASGVDFGTTTRVSLTTASDQPGPNLFRARIEDYDSGTPVMADVSLRFTPVDEPWSPPSTLRLARRDDGTYAGSGPNLSTDGRWRVEAVVQHGDSAVVVPLELDLPVPDQFVSVLDIPGSPRPPEYTMQTQDGYIRISPDPYRPGRGRIYVNTYSVFETGVRTDQIVVTAAAAGRAPVQLPVRRLGPSRFVADIHLRRGPLQVGVVAHTRDGSRLRGVFHIHIPG